MTEKTPVIDDPLVPHRIQDYALSTKLTYLAIREHGPLRTADVSAHTGISPRSVRRCVEELEADGEISIHFDPTDARTRRYTTQTDTDS